MLCVLRSPETPFSSPPLGSRDTTMAASVLGAGSHTALPCQAGDLCRGPGDRCVISALCNALPPPPRPGALHTQAGGRGASSPPFAYTSAHLRWRLQRRGSAAKLSVGVSHYHPGWLQGKQRKMTKPLSEPTLQRAAGGQWAPESRGAPCT